MALDLKRVEEMQLFYSDYLSQSESIHRCFMRNVMGIKFEKNGNIEESVALYELNLSENFEGMHPYKRLAIIYSKYKLMREAERVLRVGINNVGENHRIYLENRLRKITSTF